MNCLCLILKTISGSLPSREELFPQGCRNVNFKAETMEQVFFVLYESHEYCYECKLWHVQVVSIQWICQTLHGLSSHCIMTDVIVEPLLERSWMLVDPSSPWVLLVLLSCFGLAHRVEPNPISYLCMLWALDISSSFHPYIIILIVLFLSLLLVSLSVCWWTSREMQASQLFCI